jgi:putative hydrolase of the HAD superfamily
MSPRNPGFVPLPLDWQRIDHVLLDMDGTILDLAYDNWFWRSHVPEQYASLHGLTLEQSSASLTPHFEGLAHTLPWYCTDHWSRLTGLNIAALKRASRERVAVLLGAEAFLQAVRARGLPLWLATNAHRDSWQVKLEHTGLGHYFDRIVSSHDFGAPKEQQAFWQGLHAAYPFDKARALFVDDSLPVLRGAAAYGIGQIRAIAQPESNQPLREISEFVAVAGLKDLLPLA